MATSIRGDDGRGDAYDRYLREHGSPQEWGATYDDVAEQQDATRSYGMGEKPLRDASSGSSIQVRKSRALGGGDELSVYRAAQQ
jgi:hypothetical protein